MGRFSPTVLPTGTSVLASALDGFSEGYDADRERRRRNKAEEEERERRAEQDERQRVEYAAELYRDGFRFGEAPAEGNAGPVRRSPPLASQFGEGLESLYDENPGIGQFAGESRRSSVEQPGMPPQLAGLSDLFDPESLNMGGFREQSGNRPRSELDGSPLDTGGDDYGPGLFDSMRDRGMPPRLPKPALPGAFVLGQGFSGITTPSRYETVRPHRGEGPDEQGLYIDREATPEARRRGEQEAERDELVEMLDALPDITIEQARAIARGVPTSLVVRPERKPPHTRETDRGIEEWNPETGEYEPTGRMPYRAPREPREESWESITGEDGKLYQLNKRTGTVRPVSGIRPRASASDASSREAYFDRIATSALEATGGDVRAAAQRLTQDLTTKDVFSQGMTMRHLEAATDQRRRRPIGSVPKDRPPPPYVDALATESGSGGAFDEDAVSQAVEAIRAGQATRDHISTAANYTTAEKAEIARRVGSAP